MGYQISVHHVRTNDYLRRKLGCSDYGFKLRFDAAPAVAESISKSKESLARTVLATTLARHRGPLRELVDTSLEKLLALDERISRVELIFEVYEADWRTFFHKNRTGPEMPTETAKWNLSIPNRELVRAKRATSPGEPSKGEPNLLSLVLDGRFDQVVGDTSDEVSATFRETVDLQEARDEPILGPVQEVVDRLTDFISGLGYRTHKGTALAFVSHIHDDIPLRDLKPCTPLIPERFQISLRGRSRVKNKGRVVATAIRYWPESAGPHPQSGESGPTRVENQRNPDIPLAGLQPSGPRHAEDQRSEVRSTRTRAEYRRTSQVDVLQEDRVYVALGSNLGDRLAWIEAACREMEKQGDIRILRTSGLWETQAMYVTDQAKFLNGVCEVRTSLRPLELLDRLQAIETSLGRVKVVDKGPRNIDLDILLYGNETVESERLTVPHPLMLEREFVLRPLCELIPTSRHSESDQFIYHLNRLPPSTEKMSTLIPLSPSLPPLTPLNPTRKTHIMSILNVTPDSFSDGGLHDPTNLQSLRKSILAHIAAGATIIDVGGQSSRPHAPSITADEEIARVLPAIQLIKSLPEARNVAMSIDTYRAAVAEAAVKAGADIVNDVSAGTMDPEMLPTVARLGVTVCLMHMRGTPATMTTLTDYPDGVVETVGRELLERVNAAQEAGIRRWRIILDPGIGFAKNQAQNLELLRRLGELRDYHGLQGMPWLVGTSRKGFIGKITGVKEASERSWGTAAAVTASVQGGADVVRVHDVEEMAKVVKMADAVWRV